MRRITAKEIFRNYGQQELSIARADILGGAQGLSYTNSE